MSILRGKVVSGMGNFSYWIEKLNDHYLRKTGMRLFPGTLNVQLGEPYTLPGPVIRLEAEEYGGSVSVNIVPCSIWGKRAFILRTDANEEGRGHHPRTIVEVAPTFDSAIIFISVTARWLRLKHTPRANPHRTATTSPLLPKTNTRPNPSLINQVASARRSPRHPE